MTARRALLTPTCISRPTRARLEPVLAVLALMLGLAGCIAPKQKTTGPAAPLPPPATPPQAMAMDPARSLGLWQSSFGAVKIEFDNAQPPGHLMGVWLYDRAGQEVIGFFSGALRGNVLEFSWHEPSQPQALIGAGYLVFDPSGDSFAGKWWTRDQNRIGDWNGWRVQPQSPAQPSPNPGYGSASGAPAPRSY